MQKDLWSI